jgi:hypothetical protein
MKRNRLKALVFTATLAPAASVMAHPTVAGASPLQNAAHMLVHALQAHPWLPFATGAAVIGLLLVARMIRRES